VIAAIMKVNFWLILLSAGVILLGGALVIVFTGMINLSTSPLLRQSRRLQTSHHPG
jgi:hypothetical protein